MAGLAQGTHLLSYQLVGYVPATVLVQIRLDTTLTVDVPMERQAVVLDTLRVMAAPAGAYERKLRSVGFEMRRRDAERTATDATFIAPDEIARRRPARISQLLEGRRSVHVQYLANGFGAIARGRDGHCIMTVWLDGQLVYPDIGSLNSTGSAGMGSGLGVTQGGNGLTLATRAGGDAAGMNVIDVNQIAAIEVYPSPSGTPPQFQMLTGSCGAIVMWSKQ